MRLEIASLKDEKLGHPAVVGIEKGHVASASGANRGVPRRSGAAVGLREIPDSLAVRRQRGLELAAVRRSVVDHKHLERIEGLREHRFKRHGSVAAGAVRGNDDRNGRDEG